MLLKEDTQRPTISEILSLPVMQKYMAVLIQNNDPIIAKKLIMPGPFEFEANATAQIKKSGSANSAKPRKILAEEVKHPLSAKETIKKRREEEAQKKFEEIKIATKAAHVQIAMYFLFFTII